MTYSQWFIKQNLLCETPYFMGELAWKHQQDIINRLQMALADTEALEIGTAERLEKVTAQLESEKLSHAAWEKQSLLEYSEIVQERDALRDALVTIGDTRPGSISFLDLQVFARKAIAAWREMEGGCDETSIST